MPTETEEFCTIGRFPAREPFHEKCYEPAANNFMRYCEKHYEQWLKLNEHNLFGSGTSEPKSGSILAGEWD